MRLVYVVPFQPYPPHDGASIRIWHTLRGLAQRNEVHLVVQAEEPDVDSVREVHSMVASVTFVPPPTSQQTSREARSGRLSTFIDMCTYPPSYLRRYRSHRLLEELRPLLAPDSRTDWLLCDTQLSGQVALSRRLPPIRRSICLYDLYDAWYERKVEHTPHGRYRHKVQLDGFKAKRYETRVMQKFDLLTVVSEADRATLERRLPDRRIAVIPSGVDLEHFLPQPGVGVSCGDPRILFTGKLSYEPNADGVRYFLREVWPEVRREEPRATFVVAGMHPPDWLVARGQDDPSIVVTGEVDDMRPFYSGATVAVVPLRLGAGTKLKLLEAMAMGVPVVTTPEGCAGIEARHGEHLLVGSTTGEMVDLLLRAMRDRYLRSALAGAGRDLVTEHYGWTAIMRHYEEILLEFAGGHSHPGVPEPHARVSRTQ